jgi:hypothetical protein
MIADERDIKMSHDVLSVLIPLKEKKLFEQNICIKYKEKACFKSKGHRSFCDRIGECMIYYMEHGISWDY